MLEDQTGKTIPNVTFRQRINNEWLDINSNELFQNKTIVVFALPGAFTPTCSSSHVPLYNKLAPSFYENGVDEIICISVNDAFVMNAWKDDQKADNITFMPDGNGEFTEAMLMLVEKQSLGFGKRSWRYSMLVKNGVIEKMFIEADVAGDPFEVSDADTMLNYINPKAELPQDITMFTRPGCPFCAKAKLLLDLNNLPYEVIELDNKISETTLNAITASNTVPQIFINGEQISGYEKLEVFLEKTKAA